MLEITDIKELITLLLLRKGYSMRKLVKKMNEAGYSEMTIGGFAKMLKTKSVKFTKVQEVLDFLGYELKVVKKNMPQQNAEEFAFPLNSIQNV